MSAPGLAEEPYLARALDGVQLIEASAGTGKTYTLATLFTRLIVEQRLRMGQVLAVTYTEAATQELRKRIRERLALGAGAALLVPGSLLQALPSADAPALPAFTLVNGQAQPVSLQQLQQADGKPMVINLWATWCPPCRREMPVLAQAQQQRPDVRFIWINQGESAEAVTGYLRREQAAAPLPLAQVLFDPQQQAGRHWRQRGLPSTYFYGADGRLCGMRMGELSRASLAQHLKECS